MKSTPVTGPRGFDGGKKIDGIKRHKDTAGRLLAVHATAANVQDRAAFGPLLGKYRSKKLKRVWADKGYTGKAPAAAATKRGINLKLVSGPKPPGKYHRPTTTLGR